MKRDKIEDDKIPTNPLVSKPLDRIVTLDFALKI